MAAFLLLCVVIISDQLSKLWVLKKFALYESREVIPGLFSLTYITNRGAAFGFLNGEYGVWRHLFFVVVAVAALIFLWTAFRQFRDEGKLFGWAICLIAGGAIGNLIDRLRLGFVVDFLDFYVKGHHWPAFNIADSAITVGVSLFVLGHLFSTKKQ